jgi:tetratricopeptide (TPR) repeat protein
VVSLWTIAFTLACRLDPLLALERSRGGGSIVSLLFGASRDALSASFYTQADMFFHKGVAYSRPKTIARDPFRQALNRIAPEYHRHPVGLETAEIMPFLRLATDMDPHNIDAYLVAAFWMTTGAERPDLAADILRAAHRNNPGNYRVLLELGRLQLRRGQIDLARHALDAAIRFWPGKDDPLDRQTRLDRAEMLTYRALLHELAGAPERAADLLAEVRSLFPERTLLAERIARLRAGQPALVPALTLMREMLASRPDHMVISSAGDSHHQHDHGADEADEHEHEHESPPRP